jgi:hypothetical protein
LWPPSSESRPVRPVYNLETSFSTVFLSVLRRDLLRKKLRQQILEERRRLATKECDCIDYEPFKSCYAQDFVRKVPESAATPAGDDLYQTDNAITFWSPLPNKLRSMKRRNDFTKSNAEDYHTQFR